MRSAETAAEVARIEFDQIAAVVRDWSDVVDESGDALSFDPEVLEAACQYGWFRDGIVRAYGEAMAGAAARLGN